MDAAAIYCQYSSDDNPRLQNALSLNDRQRSSEFKDGSLVQFRAMVQDMFNPEFYLDEYEVRDTRTNQSTMKSGRFRDMIKCEPNFEINLESAKNVTRERNVFYCISIPAENNWVKKGYADKNPASTTATADEAASSSCKRPHPLDEERSPQIPIAMETGSNHDDEDAAAATKRPKSNNDIINRGAAAAAAAAAVATTTTSTLDVNDLNMPITDSEAVACIVKVYSDNAGLAPLSLNECYHFYGILSVDPALAMTDVTARASATAADDDGDGDDVNAEDLMEFSAHNPPPSMVPRLHVIKAVKVTHNNPLMMSALHPAAETEVAAFVKDAAEVRVHLHTILAQLLNGDSVAADYLICHLISSVYVRQEVVCLGKFSLNLTNVQKDQQNLVQQFYEEIVQKITTKSHLLSLSTSELNRRPFVPSKDYATNRLRSGLLQLSSNTHLIVDETGLTPGRLDTTGVRNLAALKHLITWQKLNYDFQFNSLEFMADIPVLLFSEGKSLLPADYVLPLEGGVNAAENVIEGVRHYLTPNLLDRVRIYLSTLKSLGYSVSDDMQKFIQDDFVAIRRQNANDMTADDLHSLLVLTRLMSLSIGQTSPNESTWERAKSLEAERKARLVRYNLKAT